MQESHSTKKFPYTGKKKLSYVNAGDEVEKGHEVNSVLPALGLQGAALVPAENSNNLKRVTNYSALPEVLYWGL